MTRVTAEQLATARGCVLGLVLGDAIGATGGTVPASGTLRVTSAGQLACFTVEGIIRGHVRDVHKGNTHPAGMVWALGSDAGHPGDQAVAEGVLAGRLAQVPVLSVRRGSAPAIVAALQGQEMGRVDKPVGTSVGAHGLTRSLPAGLCDWWGAPTGPFAADVAAITHAAEAMDAAAMGATIVAHCRTGQRVEEAVQRAQRECEAWPGRPARLPLLAEALAIARAKPAEATELAQLAPDARAASALAGAVYVAASFPARGQVRETLLCAASVPHGRHVAATTGAFLGAAHGVDALPVDLVSRLELVWVADILARDLVTQFVGGPSGNGYAPPTDPHWWDRYPGW